MPRRRSEAFKSGGRSRNIRRVRARCTCVRKIESSSGIWHPRVAVSRRFISSGKISLLVLNSLQPAKSATSRLLARWTRKIYSRDSREPLRLSSQASGLLSILRKFRAIEAITPYHAITRKNRAAICNAERPIIRLLFTSRCDGRVAAIVARKPVCRWI